MLIWRIEHIALNPCTAGECLAVYNDGATTWQLPTSWSADVTTVCGQIKPAAYTGGMYIGGTSPAGTSIGGTAPPQAHAPPAYVATVAPQTNVFPVATLPAATSHRHKVNWTQVVKVVGDLSQIAQAMN